MLSFGRLVSRVARVSRSGRKNGRRNLSSNTKHNRNIHVNARVINNLKSNKKEKMYHFNTMYTNIFALQKRSITSVGEMSEQIQDSAKNVKEQTAKTISTEANSKRAQNVEYPEKLHPNVELVDRNTPTKHDSAQGQFVESIKEKFQEIDLEKDLNLKQKLHDVTDTMTAAKTSQQKQEEEKMESSSDEYKKLKHQQQNVGARNPENERFFDPNQETPTPKPKPMNQTSGAKMTFPSVEEIKDGAENMKERVQTAARTVKNKIENNVPENTEEAKGKAQDTWESMQETASSVKTKAENMMPGDTKEAQEKVHAAMNSMQETASKASEKISETAKAMKEKAKNAYDRYSS